MNLVILNNTPASLGASIEIAVATDAAFVQ